MREASTNTMVQPKSDELESSAGAMLLSMAEGGSTTVSSSTTGAILRRQQGQPGPQMSVPKTHPLHPALAATTHSHSPDSADVVVVGGGDVVSTVVEGGVEVSASVVVASSGHSWHVCGGSGFPEQNASSTGGHRHVEQVRPQ